MSTKKENSSALSMLSRLRVLMNSGCAVIQVRTREVHRATRAIRDHLVNHPDHEYKEWSHLHGFRTFTPDNALDDLAVPGDNSKFPVAITQPLKDLQNPNSGLHGYPDKIHVYLYVNAGLHMPTIGPVGSDILTNYATTLPTSNALIILVTGLDPLPVSPGTVMIADMDTPSVDELGECLRNLLDSEGIKDLTKEEVDGICRMGAGMTLSEFETHVALHFSDCAQTDAPITAEGLLDSVSKGKVEVVKQSGVLELTPAGDIQDVGGMEALKKWIEDRKDAFTPEAREFGLEPPKGIMMAGLPGTGKSLAAKAIAGIMRVPLIKFDFGKVYSRYVGESEGRIREALSMIDAMGRSVILVDEVDKALGGGGGETDGGTSARVLGTFLTWMQETKSESLVVMTANKVWVLPPELSRKGRMDEVFSVGLPNADDRVEVLGIHLRKRGIEMSSFDRNEIGRFKIKSEGYIPAEIEQAVKNALVAAYNDKEADDLGMNHIIAALESMVPMSVSHAEQVERILDWASNNAVSASASHAQSAIASVPQRTTRVRRGRSQSNGE